MGFCPKCGKKQEKFELCSNCTDINFEVKDFKIVCCAYCNSFFYKNVWKKYDDIFKVLEIYLKDNTKSKFDLIHNDEIEQKPGIKKQVMTTVMVEGAEIELPVNYEVTVCNSCKAATGQGFHGILQLRADPLLEHTKEIVRFAKNEIIKGAKKGIHCVNEEITKHGHDFYLTDKKFIAELARILQSNFGGFMSLNEQLFSMDKQTSKDLFRLNVLYRPPKFKKNDIIVINNVPVKVGALGKDIIAYSLVNSTKSAYRYDDFEILEKRKTTVSKVIPSIEILDLDTYESVIASNPFKKEVKVDYNCKYVKFNGKYYIV